MGGVMTYVVNQDGVVSEKDVGADTAKNATVMKEHNPDKTWSRLSEREGIQCFSAAMPSAFRVAPSPTRLAEPTSPCRSHQPRATLNRQGQRPIPSARPFDRLNRRDG